MPFETSAMAQKNIAIVGAGISGMGAAYELSKNHRVVLFEAEKRLGGHARTRMAGRNADQSVDTGFIVFNYANYPNLTSLFDELGVKVEKSNMSFGASIDGGRIEYGLAGLDALFAQRTNFLRPQFLRMCRDIFHFNANALEASSDPEMKIGGLIEKLALGPWFRDYYLAPLSGAIWSTPVEKIMDFPARAMIQFFENHALLNHTGQHQWYTVSGGSQNYVERLGTAMHKQGVDIRLGAAVQAVRRDPMGVEVKTWSGDWERFDEIIFATHSDDTLSLIADPTEAETSTLGAIGYQPNKIVLHSDTSIMPKSRKVWSSWVYTEDREKPSERIDLTYWMNSLQPWLTKEEFMVTLNTTRPIREDLIWDEVTLRHPVYDLKALAAQKTAAEMNGTNRTWFCGAWMKHGFHEDGLSSALDVGNAIQSAPENIGVAAE